MNRKRLVTLTPMPSDRSDEEVPSPATASCNLPAVTRACDTCYQRKTRCDGAKRPQGCSNCLAFNSACTYVRRTQKRGPKPKENNKLIEQLKQRNAYLEAKLRSLSICSLCAQPLKSESEDNSSPITSASVFTQASTKDAPHAEDPLVGNDLKHVELAELFRSLCIESTTEKALGSVGPSSSFLLVSNTIKVKEKFLGRRAAQHSRRALFWDSLPWEKEVYDLRPHYVYPATDLIASLLDLYFTNVHPSLPILHRPSFELSVAEELHLRDPAFGGVLLAVLGVASRYSNDPRVFVEGDGSLSSGWKFINQLQVARKVFEPTLYDVQFYCLMTLFYLGTSAPQNSWLYLGLGITLLRQRGEHQRKRKNKPFDPEEEKWKRAIWSLFSLDLLVSIFKGRPAGLHAEDYDVELPLEVDDEYWEHGCTQPSGQPSLLSYFVCHVRLYEILGDALRRLYASNKSRGFMGWTGLEWEERAVAELDSALNDWLDTVPLHLRWDPKRFPGPFFDQSALLYATYYYVQIVIHRPYIHKDTSALASPSLSICTSAARSTIRIADVWLRKTHRLPLSFLMNSVFFSGVILLLNIFGNKRSGLSIDKNKDLAHVETAIMLHQFAESRWQPAGRMVDLLQALKSLDAPLPPRSAPDPLWNNVFTAEPSLPLVNAPEAELSFEQLLADTAQFDTVNLSINSEVDGWNGTSGPTNGALDDEIMSLWMAAPTCFAFARSYLLSLFTQMNYRDVEQWDLFLEAGMADVNWTSSSAPQ
ncbi:fungal-specific transcription factor domain-containing protein [Mycena vulgaris]|nr:fungal-specific transcription factor domain-containing protein [Mycena vulgaris]